ncbi:MAG: sigma factor [Marmoricola sp.]
MPDTRASTRTLSPAPPTVASDGLPDLFTRVAAGDADAFAGVYDATAARVYDLAVRLVTHDADGPQAAEVAQEAFLEIWRTSRSFDPARGQRSPGS